MGKQKVLSSKFNMSLGYIPVIISIILCEFIIQDIAIYIGTGVGLLFSIYMLQRKGSHVPPIILYCTTGMLLLLTITSFFSTDYCSEAMFPLTLEISAIIPPFVIFLNRKRFLNYHAAQTHKCCKQFFAQGAEAAIVSARVLLLFGFLHFLITSLTIFFGHPLSNTTRYVLFRIVPPSVFILSILFNQFGIYYFNKVMKHTVFIPIVTTKGDVIGKAIASEAINRKNEYINPVILIYEILHPSLQNTSGQLTSDKLLQVCFRYLHLFRKVEDFKNISIAFKTNSSQKSSYRQFLFTVDVSVHHIVDVRSELDP